jgi:hypothetical protein
VDSITDVDSTCVFILSSSHRVYKLAHPYPFNNQMSSSAVQKFCTDFELPDLSLLIGTELSESKRYALIWRAIQTRISVDKQRAFLRLFCKDCPCLAANLLFSFVSMEIDEKQCSDAMGIILTAEGTADLLGVPMKALCLENNIAGAITLMERSDLESVVYSIEYLFKVKEERMMVALDHLKYDTNPTTFTRRNDRLVQKLEALFTEKMTVLSATLDRLNTEAIVLEKRLLDQRSNSPASTTTTTAVKAAPKRRRAGPDTTTPK